MLPRQQVDLHKDERRSSELAEQVLYCELITSTPHPKDEIPLVKDSVSKYLDSISLYSATKNPVQSSEEALLSIVRLLELARATIFPLPRVTANRMLVRSEELV